MNAFLIFCKRHRTQVREKYPHLENRQVTKILGEWWADLPADQKTSYTELAREYKEAFLRANPHFKWYKIPAQPPRPPPARPSNQKVPRSEPLPTAVGGITFGKLADEAQMGGLSTLLSTASSSSSTPNLITTNSSSCLIFDSNLNFQSDSFMLNSRPPRQDSENHLCHLVNSRVHGESLPVIPSSLHTTNSDVNVSDHVPSFHGAPVYTFCDSVSSQKLCESVNSWKTLTLESSKNKTSCESDKTCQVSLEVTPPPPPSHSTQPASMTPPKPPKKRYLHETTLAHSTEEKRDSKRPLLGKWDTHPACMQKVHMDGTSSSDESCVFTEEPLNLSAKSIKMSCGELINSVVDRLFMVGMGKTKNVSGSDCNSQAEISVPESKKIKCGLLINQIIERQFQLNNEQAEENTGDCSKEDKDLLTKSSSCGLLLTSVTNGVKTEEVKAENNIENEDLSSCKVQETLQKSSHAEAKVKREEEKASSSPPPDEVQTFAITRAAKRSREEAFRHSKVSALAPMTTRRGRSSLRSNHGNHAASSGGRSRSQRACKGKRYEELISEGVLQTPRRSRGRNTNRLQDEDVSPLNEDKGSLDDTKDLSSSEKEAEDDDEDFDSSPVVSKNIEDQMDAVDRRCDEGLKKPKKVTKKFKPDEFDLEARIEALPSLSLDDFTRRKKDKKRTVVSPAPPTVNSGLTSESPLLGEKSESSNSSDIASDIVSDVSSMNGLPEAKEVPADTHTSHSFRVESSQATCDVVASSTKPSPQEREVKSPLPNDPNASLDSIVTKAPPLIGSQKRKARKQTITRHDPLNSALHRDTSVIEPGIFNTYRLHTLADVALGRPSMNT